MTLYEAEEFAKKSNLNFHKTSLSSARNSFAEVITDKELVKKSWMMFHINHTDGQREHSDIEHTLIQQCREHFRILTFMCPEHYAVEIDSPETYLKFKLIYGDSMTVISMIFCE